MTYPIPQPKPDPILGNLRDIDTYAPVQSLMRLAKTYGPVYQLTLPGAKGRRIFVSSHELADELFDESRFDKKVHASLEQIRDFAGDGLFTAHTDEPNWESAHRILMPAFGPLPIREMFPEMYDVADQLLLRWERFGEDAVIDVADNMTRLTLDTIALCAFDYRFNSFYQNELHPFVGAMVDALAEAGARARRPSFATQVKLRAKRHYEADIQLMHQISDQLIAERRRDPNAGEKKDLLARMLAGRDPKTGQGLSDENIRHQMVTFLIAGHETTSGLLSFALYFLLKNPEALEKARAEVDAVLGNDLPSVQHLPKLGYIDQILKETLRIWPTAPAIGLRPLQDTVIGGRYELKTDDTVMVLLPMLHRDPAVWGDDVEAFKPERFDSQAFDKLLDNAWKPFGNGQRACIGRPFAMQEAQLVLASVLQRFELVQADPSYQLKVKETLTLKPQNFRIRAKRRGKVTGEVTSQVSFKPQHVGASSTTTLPSQPLTPSQESSADGAPLLVLYGSDSGSSEAFAQRIASEAAARGYAADLGTLDEHSSSLPKDGAVVIVTASYEGQPTQNAKQFVAWAETLKPGDLADVRYTVFGCGNRDWQGTYQAVPKKLDALLDAAGAERIKARGEADASGDFFGGFEAWYETLWRDLGRALGQAVKDGETAGARLEVEFVRGARQGVLRQNELQLGEVTENRELVDMSSPLGRSKRHLEIKLPAGMTYHTGDYLTVLPTNPPQNVERALRRFTFAVDDQIVIRSRGLTSLPTGYPVSVGDLLVNYVELAQPATKKQLEALAQATRCPPEKRELEALVQNYDAEVLAKRMSVLELLERFQACELSFADFLTMLPPLRARQYSISSSPLWKADHCTLTFSVLDAPAASGQGRYVGVASSFLAHAEPGTRIPVAVRPPNAAFHPPASPETPIIMACAGTGVAPFHGFLQERALQKQHGQKVGPALLFFGCDAPDVDFLYQEELKSWEDAGVVRVHSAFSHQPEAGAKYVQDRLWQDRHEVETLFRQNAHIYVCGDGKRMAPAVRETFVRIYQEAAQVSFEAANSWADELERTSTRYVADVFA